MTRRKLLLWATLLALPLAVAGGLVYANAHARAYVCPITGEVLACEKCCPLNESKQQTQEQSYTCPITGKELPCPLYCPLNQQK